jgi:hypothetical protein
MVKNTLNLVGLDVELAVEGVSTVVHQFEGVRPVAVHVTIAIGGAAIGEEEHHLAPQL